MNLANVRVVTRLSVGFASLIALLLLISAVCLAKMQNINQQLTSIVDVNNIEAVHLSAMRAAAYEQSLALRNMALAPDQAEMSKYADELKRQVDAYGQAESDLGKMFSTLAETTETEKKSFTVIKEQADKAQPTLLQLIEHGKAGRIDDIKKLLAGDFPVLQAKRRASLAELYLFEEVLNKQASDDAKTAYSQALYTIIILGSLAVVVGAAGAVVITRSLVSQLGGEPNYAAALAQKIAGGDLTTVIATKGRNQDSLLVSMKTMNEGLLNIVREVRIGTEAITTASGQIAAGNLDLSARTEQQAGSLEETSSAMEQLTSTVQQNSEHAQEANKLASSASAIALQGGEIVRQVVDTMTAIDDSSKKIVDIISVIDGIAFQTNILALNAAVEAARAGEQGRGFAVVASEVRNLAQRSSAAAKEIKLLIGDSVEKVGSGNKLVEQAGQTMAEVVTSVKSVADVIVGITEASREQSAGIASINQAITQMDQATQQNAALVEQAAAAAQAMQEQARKLSGVVATFSVG